MEGESLFNDASSLTLFEIFYSMVENKEDKTVGQEIAEIVLKTLWAGFTGICIGLGTGIFNHIVFYWLEHRNMKPKAYVAFSVAGSYLSFYICQACVHAVSS